jgi:hypothetical protein
MSNYRNKPTLCPHCGGLMPSDKVLQALTIMQRRLFEIVKVTGTAGITRADIMAKLYGDEIGERPRSMGMVSVMANNMNLRLKEFGIRLKSSGGHGALWRIVERDDG